MQREIQFQFFVVKSHLQEFIFQNFYYLLTTQNIRVYIHSNLDITNLGIVN